MPFLWALWLCRFVQTSAAVLLVGTAVLRLLASGTGLDPVVSGWRALAWASGVLLLVAGTWQLGLTAAEMSGEPLARIFSNGVLREVLGGTHFGAVWIVRMGLVAGWLVFALAAARLRRYGRRRAPAALEMAGSLLAVAVLGSLVLAGHAQASEKSAWLLPVAVCHAVAAGAWPGGLLPLLLLLGQAQRRAFLVPAAVVVTRRFSRLSVVAVGVLAFSGALNGVGMVGTFAALWTSPYGRLVLCKVALFALMIGLGAINRRLVRRQDPADGARTMVLLWRNVAVECALAVGVLLATEALGTSAPPMPAAGSPGKWETLCQARAVESVAHAVTDQSGAANS